MMVLLFYIGGTVECQRVNMSTLRTVPTKRGVAKVRHDGVDSNLTVTMMMLNATRD